MLKFVEFINDKIFNDEFLSKDSEVVEIIWNFYLNYWEKFMFARNYLFRFKKDYENV